MSLLSVFWTLTGHLYMELCHSSGKGGPTKAVGRADPVPRLCPVGGTSSLPVGDESPSGRPKSKTTDSTGLLCGALFPDSEDACGRGKTERPHVHATLMGLLLGIRHLGRAPPSQASPSNELLEPTARLK